MKDTAQQSPRPSTRPRRTVQRVAPLLAVLLFAEFTSGIFQGYYTPMLSDIARHLDIHDADVNWFDSGQALFSAAIVPVLAKLGDMLGHRRMLLVATAITAAAASVLPFASSFPVFLVAWAFAGAYVAWLPLEIALLWSRGTHGSGRRLGGVAGLLVAALQVGAITGALLGGLLTDIAPLPLALAVPAALAIACFALVLFATTDEPRSPAGRFDTSGAILLSLSLAFLLGGLGLVRAGSVADAWWWLLILFGVLLLSAFIRHESRVRNPLIDLSLFRSPALATVSVVAGLFGLSVIASHAPLSTFARTDPDAVGYGLGTSGFQTSLIIGIYVLALAVGALLFSFLSRRVSPRFVLAGAGGVIAMGFLLLLTLHSALGQVMAAMALVGTGAGAMVAALPVVAASTAPSHHTGVATGLTNSTKALGVAIGSCIFGTILVQGGTATAQLAGAAPVEGYLLVWGLCAAVAAVCSALFLALPNALPVRANEGEERPAAG